ncbi:hypothetical protein ACSBR2_035515 [Camellia fascicularis]
MREYGSVHRPYQWYRDLPIEVCILVDGVGFGIFYLGITSLQADRSIFGTLVEGWWDTTNFFHFSSTREMTMTPSDLSIITNLLVGGEPILFDHNLSQWPVAEMFLLGALPSFTRHGIIRYN